MVEHKHGHFVGEDFPRPVKALAAVSRWVATLEGVGIAISLATLIFLATWQFAARNLRMRYFPSFPLAPDWTDNVLRHSVFLIGFMGAMFASYTARHLRVDAVTRLAAPRGRLLLRVIATTGAFLLLVVMILAANSYREVVSTETAMAGEIFTASRGAMIVVVGAVVMAFHSFVQIVIDLTYLLGGREIPDWWAAEAAHGGEALLEEDPVGGDGRDRTTQTGGASA